MISFKIREKETEKTVRRAITQCQDKEKSPESSPSQSYTTAIKKSFDTFMEAMINDYLNSDSMPKCSDADFVGKIEIIEESA